MQDEEEGAAYLSLLESVLNYIGVKEGYAIITEKGSTKTQITKVRVIPEKIDTEMSFVEFYILETKYSINELCKIQSIKEDRYFYRIYYIKPNKFFSEGDIIVRTKINELDKARDVVPINISNHNDALKHVQAKEPLVEIWYKMLYNCTNLIQSGTEIPFKYRVLTLTKIGDYIIDLWEGFQLAPGQTIIPDISNSEKYFIEINDLESASKDFENLYIKADCFEIIIENGN